VTVSQPMHTIEEAWLLTRANPDEYAAAGRLQV
jgi:hypothetical protein